MGRVVLHHSHCTSDTTRRRVHGRMRGAQGRGARHGGWAHGLGVVWPTGCALGALNLFLTRFDSVPFLSQFLEIVLEPGS